MPAIPTLCPSVDAQDPNDSTNSGVTLTSLLRDGPQERCLAVQPRVSRRGTLNVDKSIEASRESMPSDSLACEGSPHPSVQTVDQNGASGSFPRSRSIARATRPPNLPLVSSSLAGIYDASASPPERLSMWAPTSARQCALAAPTDATETLETPSAIANFGSSIIKRPGPPDTLEPGSAHSHRSVATFGGHGDLDSPRSRTPSFTSPHMIPRHVATSLVRRQSLDGQQTATLPPRPSSASHPSDSIPSTAVVPTRTTSLGGGHEASGIRGVSFKDDPLPLKPAAIAEDVAGGDGLRSSDCRSLPRGSELRVKPHTTVDLKEVIKVNYNAFGPRLEPTDQDAMTETMSLNCDMMSESGHSVAPLLPRPSTDSQAWSRRASSDSGHFRPVGARFLPRPARVSQSLDFNGSSLNASILNREQKALLIRRNRKLEQVLGQSLQESEIGQFVVEPSVGGSTVLTKVVDEWPEARGPEWARDDCVPQITETTSEFAMGLQRKQSKVKRSMDVLRSPGLVPDVQVYVSRETSVTETVAPAYAHMRGVNGQGPIGTPPSPSSPALSSPPLTPFQTREEVVRARRRAQLAKLQRILGSPISPHLILAPELDEVPTCGLVRTPSETSFGSQRKAPLRERVKSFVIPSPVYSMSETERRLARKRASKLEHLFGDPPPQEMFLPVVRPLEPSLVLSKIHEAGGTPVEVPGSSEPGTGFPVATLRHAQDGAENRMFVSTSPAAAAKPSPEDTFEGYKHSLQGLMHLLENNQAQLGRIIDQLEPQPCNVQPQPDAVVHEPACTVSFSAHTAPSCLVRRSSAPPIPLFSPRHPNYAGGAAGGSDVDGDGRQDSSPQRPLSPAQQRLRDEVPRPSLQLYRRNRDPFSEYLRSQSADLQRSIQQYPDQSEPDQGKDAGAASATGTVRWGTATRKLSSFFGKSRTPGRLTFLQDGSNAAFDPVIADSAPPATLHAAAPATPVETDPTSTSGTLRKKDRRVRKFSTLFSTKASRGLAAALDQQRSDPFFARRQTLDGILSEMRSSIMLDMSNGHIRPGDAHTLLELLQALNRIRADTPWAEVKVSEP